MLRKEDKRGQIFAIILIVAFLVVAFILIYFISVLNNNIVSELEDAGLTSTEANDTIQEAKETMIPLGDNMIFWLFIAFVGGLIVWAVFADFHPVVIIVLIIFFIMAVVLAMMSANIYDDMKTDLEPEIEGDQTFTFSDVIQGRYLPVFIIIIGIIVVWILYTGSRNKSNAGGF